MFLKTSGTVATVIFFIIVFYIPNQNHKLLHVSPVSVTNGNHYWKHFVVDNKIQTKIGFFNYYYYYYFCIHNVSELSRRYTSTG